MTTVPPRAGHPADPGAGRWPRRRSVLVTGLAALLAGGCENGRLSGYLPAPADNDRLIADALGKLERPALVVRIGDSPRLLLPLAWRDGEGSHWISRDRSILTTRNGRITGTYGFGRDLAHTRHDKEDPLALLARGVQMPPVWHWRRHVDFRGEEAMFGLEIVSVLRRLGQETVHLHGRPYRLDLWEEDARLALLDWSFVNRFWLSPRDGRVRTSLQWIRPDQEAIGTWLAGPASPAPLARAPHPAGTARKTAAT